eukprot:TRINITY_DN7026_c0_g1_i2.p1 TRINITY_DN7026_c0_g1~~TRINITY_DN7026_c0_g1_i2.p1  ORF type:complete len:335 (-),score=43.43 TRINITY_DN7026_c0_g1_i2:302-1306(-)
MLWKIHFSGEPIQNILFSPNPSLNALLEIEDLIHEARYGNEQLIAFLARPDILAELLRYALGPDTPPAPDPNDADAGPPPTSFEWTGRRQVAVGLLEVEMPQVCASLAAHDHLLQMVFSVLEVPPPLQGLRGTALARLVSALTRLELPALLRWLFKQPSSWPLLPRLLTHIACDAIPSVFVTLLLVKDVEVLPPTPQDRQATFAQAVAACGPRPAGEGSGGFGIGSPQGTASADPSTWDDPSLDSGMTRFGTVGEDTAPVPYHVAARAALWWRREQCLVERVVAAMIGAPAADVTRQLAVVLCDAMSRSVVRRPKVDVGRTCEKDVCVHACVCR